MRVSVILNINGCLPLCCGNKGSTTQIMIKPSFLENIIYRKRGLLQKYLLNETLHV